MRVVIDSSVFLHLLLDEKRANEAESLLSSVETGSIIGYVTTHVLEEVSFKLLLAKGSELGESSFWGFKKRFASDANFREKCLVTLSQFRDYVSSLKGLILEGVTVEDWKRSIGLLRYGILTSDALIAAVAMRLGVPVYTFDLDFARIPGLEVRP